MTTIAYKDGMLASDGQVSGPPGVKWTMKLFRRDGAVYGGAGVRSDIQALADWYFSDRKEPPKYFLHGDQPNAEILVMHDDGKVYYCGWGAFPQEIPGYAAIGSGSHYAVGAMFMGASALRAVEAATCHDSDTGGGIMYAARRGAVLEYKG